MSDDLGWTDVGFTNIDDFSTGYITNSNRSGKISEIVIEPPEQHRVCDHYFVGHPSHGN